MLHCWALFPLQVHCRTSAPGAVPQLSVHHRHRAPHAAAHPTDKWVRHIVAQLNSIESTLDLIASA
ncbi:hypothetical protein SBADM41S_09766 [Streptomyces badius]